VISLLCALFFDPKSAFALSALVGVRSKKERQPSYVTKEALALRALDLGEYLFGSLLSDLCPGTKQTPISIFCRAS
jgi:hypothetical protein